MKEYVFSDMTIKQYVYPYINSNMYLLCEENSALIIDPHENKAMLDLLKKNNIKDILLLLTHEHPDHTSGIVWLQKNFETKLICQKRCAEYIAIERNNRPILISFVLAEKDKMNGTHMAKQFNKSFPSYYCQADVVFDQNYLHQWHGHNLSFVSIPGHSAGSVAIILDDIIVFSGDSLINGIETITRFPGGSIRDYNEITVPFLKKLNRNVFILPGHGQGFRLKDYKEHVQL